MNLEKIFQEMRNTPLENPILGKQEIVSEKSLKQLVEKYDKEMLDLTLFLLRGLTQYGNLKSSKLMDQNN